MKSVSVATCCYEKDYKTVMEGNWLNMIFSRFNCEFVERILVVNTDETEEIRCLSQRLLEDSVVDNIYYCGEFAERIKKAFRINNFFMYSIIKVFQF